MKIYYPAYVRLPTEKAHGIQIMKTCEALALEGAEVELVIPGRATTINADPVAYYGVAKNFTITTARVPDWVRFGPIGFVLSMLWFSKAAKMRKDFWKADVVYSRDAGLLIQYLFLGRKFVYEAHRAPTWIDWIVAHRAHRVVVITESLKREFMKRGVHAEKIVVAHDAVDVAPAARPRAELGLPAGPLVVYAGSLKPEKGVGTLRAAAPLMTGVSLEIISGKNPQEAREMLAAADVVVVPNSAHHESARTFTSPMKLFEALASGARVVASDVPAIREVVGEDAVWFFTPDDATDLARAVHEALTDPRAPSKIAAAQALARQYSWRARARIILGAL